MEPRCPPCACACCDHRAVLAGELFCESRIHPNPPQGVKRILAVRNCHYWDPEPPDAPPLPEWLRRIYEEAQAQA